MAFSPLTCFSFVCSCFSMVGSSGICDGPCQRGAMCTISLHAIRYVLNTLFIPVVSSSMVVMPIVVGFYCLLPEFSNKNPLVFTSYARRSPMARDFVPTYPTVGSRGHGIHRFHA
jgi:hypothetical protein